MSLAEPKLLLNFYKVLALEEIIFVPEDDSWWRSHINRFIIFCVRNLNVCQAHGWVDSDIQEGCQSCGRKNNLACGSTTSWVRDACSGQLPVPWKLSDQLPLSKKKISKLVLTPCALKMFRLTSSALKFENQLLILWYIQSLPYLKEVPD